MKSYLGVEFGSTRIKAVVIDENAEVISSSQYNWASTQESGIWTYPIEDVWEGLRYVLSHLDHKEGLTAAGISAMMHGYLAFDKDWNLLVPFRTWQNTMTGQSASMLSDLFEFNIPQRWSIAHLYQALLNNEPHIKDIAHITTLAGYVHFMLTGVNKVGIGEASGIIPVDSLSGTYDSKMIEKFNALIKPMNLGWSITDIIPGIAPVGESCGTLTQDGCNLINQSLPLNLTFCPPEGDAETGMVASNAISPRTGNVSAGTSIFSMVVLQKPLKKVHPECGIVMTPTGKPVAMVHCSNCSIDINHWVALLKQSLGLLGLEADDEAIYARLFELAQSGDEDCGGLVFCNYVSGESVTHLDSGIPFFLRQGKGAMNLANFVKASIYSAMVTLSLGMDLLKDEEIEIDSLTAHGGLFKTPAVAQTFLANACACPVTVMKTSGEGGPYGMALLASYLDHKAMSLDQYLEKKVFASAQKITIRPTEEATASFALYKETFRKALELEKKALEIFK